GPGLLRRRLLLPAFPGVVAVARVDVEVLGVDELVAGRDEGLGRFLLAETVHGQALLADTRGQAGEVAVAGNDAETVEIARVHQVHRVDDQRAVGGVLAGGVVELLDRRDRVGEQAVLPAAKVARGPVAVGAAHAGVAALGDLRQQLRQARRVGVVGIGPDGEAGTAAGTGDVDLRCSAHHPRPVRAQSRPWRTALPGGPPAAEPSSTRIRLRTSRTPLAAAARSSARCFIAREGTLPVRMAMPPSTWSRIWLASRVSSS